MVTEALTTGSGEQAGPRGAIRQSPEGVSGGRQRERLASSALLYCREIHSPVLVTDGKGLKPQVLKAHASGTSPHMLACSSTSPAEKCNWQIGHWTQETGDELSEDTHSTDGDAGGDEEGEAGLGGEVSPQVAACWGRVSMLKEPKEERKISKIGTTPRQDAPQAACQNAAVFVGTKDFT